MKSIHVASIDYDGCLSARSHSRIEYYTSANQPLINFMKANKDKFDKEIVLVGSNRQSLSLDGNLSIFNRNGSCFMATALICKHLNIEFDKFILSDIYLNQESGFTLNEFFKAVESDKLKVELQDQVFDAVHFSKLYEEDQLKPLFQLQPGKFFTQDKINLLYAQLQKIASEHPDDQILFDFFDDKEDILNSLDYFFRQYPSLIAENVTLRLFQYKPNVFKPMAHSILNADKTISITHGIKGTGNIDFDYYQTVKNMGEIAERHEPQGINSNGYSMSSYLTPALLEELRQEKIGASTLLSIADSNISASAQLGFFPLASLPGLNAPENPSKTAEALVSWTF